jgi:hypothetical protein
MKKVIWFVLLMPFVASAQIFESFESGNLSGWVQSIKGHWDTDSISSISGKFSLHHAFDNPDAGADQSGITLNNLHPSEGLTRWSFLVRHGYDPSSSNNWALFLMSDSDPSLISPDVAVRGFAVGVNITGYDDTLRLWKVNGSSVIEVVNSRINWQNNIGINQPVRVVTERSSDGNWEMSVYQLNGQLINTSYGFDSTLFPVKWLNVYYKYSSTRDRLLWLDDIRIEGSFYEDLIAPLITRCDVTGTNSLEITFSEEPSVETILPVNFSFNLPANRSVSVLRKTSLTYKILFGNTFINKEVNYLNINYICDHSNNCSERIQIAFSPVWAQQGDVVITEIMADPVPFVSLPPKEYIEITNRTGYSFNLKNWVIITESRREQLPAVIIGPGRYLILCSVNDTLSFKQYGEVAGLEQFPVLNDKGMIIALSDTSGSLIHGTEYSSKWYREELKASGGWALELIDAGYPFYQEENWRASDSKKGGTPGKENSVSSSNPDYTFGGIVNVFPYDPGSINILFSEPVRGIESSADFTISEGLNVTDNYPIDLLYREFQVKTDKAFVPGRLYSLTVSGNISDFAGNKNEKSGFIFGLPENSESRDIVFNEILFNPYPGDPDYIELFNNSDKVIDASSLYLVAVNDETGDTSEIFSISAAGRCILPGCYYTVTTDKKKVIRRYHFSDLANIFEVGSLPSMSDDDGHLILYNRELDKIDEVFYNDNMHYSLLVENEGVSLEKIRPDGVSSERSNWHSASESSGWGTPGTHNSSFVNELTVNDNVILSSTKISPDSDGNEDFLVIDFNLKGLGNIISVTIFDETGTFVRRLADNLLAGPDTLITWDGNSGDGKLVRTGIYIVFIEMFNSFGKVQKWKKVCTVINGK